MRRRDKENNSSKNYYLKSPISFNDEKEHKFRVLNSSYDDENEHTFRVLNTGFVTNNAYETRDNYGNMSSPQTDSDSTTNGNFNIDNLVTPVPPAASLNAKNTVMTSSSDSYYHNNNITDNVDNRNDNNNNNNNNNNNEY